MIPSEDSTGENLNTAVLAPRLSWNRIFHPTDLSPSSAIAFLHALRLATCEQGQLTILHTHDDRGDRHWDEFPRIRPTLEKWGMLPPDSPAEAVAALGLNIRKISSTNDDPVDSLLHYLYKHPHDLIVLATHQYSGIARLRHKTVAEEVVRRTGEMALYLPEGCLGFIDAESGVPLIRNILIPFDRDPDPQIAVEAAASIARSLACDEVTFTLCHVGLPQKAPDVRIYQGEKWLWRSQFIEGKVNDQILEVADQTGADLIVMATQGHHGFLDALRGSTTERIVRHAECPVLAVPAIEPTPASLQESPVWSSAD